MRHGLLAAMLLAVAAAPVLASDEAQDKRTETFAELPYWPGYWVSLGQAGTTIGGLSAERDEAARALARSMAVGGGNAPWNDLGKAKWAEHRRTASGRKANGWGFPGMMSSAAPMQFLITPEEVLIVNPYSDVRHIYTDGRPMPSADDMWPTVWGTSVGHWEGDVLVIETRAVRDPSLYFHGGPPLSDEAVYEERIRLKGDRLECDLTITDPATLTEPWKIRIIMVREEGYDRMVQMDYDNDRTGFDGEFNTIEPPKDEE